MQNPFDPGYFETDELRTFGFASIGENVRIAKNCTIIGIENLSIGDHSRIDAFTTIISTGPVHIGSYVHIGGYCHLSGRGGISIGDFAGLSQAVKVYSASDDYSGSAMTNPTVPVHLTKTSVAPIAIGRHAIVGSGSVILPGCDLGEGAAIGALSLVTNIIPAWTIAGGTPCKVIKERRREPLSLERFIQRARTLAA